ncbi:MAG TPA: TIM-barrel domain-containing protein [Cellvibrio sp.]|nr:TIM-barrel domain-containing protein [Cellvibrio sp.]
MKTIKNTVWLQPLRSIPLLCLVLLCGNALAADYQSHRLDGQTLHIQTNEGELTLAAYGNDALEVHYIAQSSKQLPSFSIGSEPLPTQVSVREDKSSLDFIAGNVKARIEKSPLKVSYYRGKELLLAEEKGFFNYETLRGFRFALQPEEKLLGGGERILPMDRRGTNLPLYNKPTFGYKEKGEQMYYGVPALLSSRKYMLVFDNSARGSIDIGARDKNILQFEASAGRTAYLVIAGDSYPQLLNNFVQLTGKQPLPPRWTFGNFASRFGYRTEAQTRDTVAKYQSEDIPLDAVILDLYWFGPDIKGHMGTLDWDRKTFPTPEKMMSDFAKDGVKTLVITEPFILKSSKRWQEAVDKKVLAKNIAGNAQEFPLYFGDTGIVDIFDSSAASWFSQIYQGLLKQGVSGIWADLGEPEAHPGDTIHAIGTADEIHNAYGHQWTKLIDDAGKSVSANERLFILARSGFVGTQRYGILPWTGDVSRTWEGLAAQVGMSLSMSLTGLAYTHSDLGGFIGDDQVDIPLYTRWLQYGIFQPVYRPHSSDNVSPEPVFADAETKKILRDFIKLRYQLLPYNYTLAYENSTTGMPLMRPVFFEDESNPGLMDEKFQYLWGDAFLVKPVVQANITSLPIALPKGQWFNFWNDSVHQGGKTIDFALSMDTFPVLVRAGSFIPMIDPISTTRDYSSKNLTLHYYAHKDVKKASGKMYEDDGISRDALEKKNYQLLKFNAEQKNNKIDFSFSKEGQGYSGVPGKRDITLVLHNWQKQPGRITLGDINVALNADTNQLPKASYDSEKKQLTVKFSWEQDAARLKIQ